MSFRDETETLRARIRDLEDELRMARRERDAAVEALDAQKAFVRSNRIEAIGEQASGFLRVGLVGVLAVGGLAVGIWAFGSTTCSGPTVPFAMGLDVDSPPTAGMIDLDATPAPTPVDLVASGDGSAPSGCYGYVPSAPQLVIRTSRRVAIRATATATAGGDLVAVMRLPDGSVLCDDDGDGSLNPRIVGMLPPGDTRVWIGTYSGGDSTGFRFTLHADDAEPPAPSAAAAALSGPGDGAHGTATGSVVGTAEAATFDPSCRGYLPATPQLSLHLTEPAAVHVAATGSDDLVLFIRESDGHVKCDDDSGPGVSPRIATLLPAGDHAVYVGTYSALDHPAVYTLVGDVVRVDPAAPPTAGSHALAADSPFSIEGRSAGIVSPTALGARCLGGLVPAAPQIVLDLAAPGDVVLSLASDGQPFIIVSHGERGGFECLTTGHARLPFAAGSHRIYVGVADEGDESDFTLGARLEAPTLRPWSP